VSRRKAGINLRGPTSPQSPAPTPTAASTPPPACGRSGRRPLGRAAGDIDHLPPASSQVSARAGGCHAACAHHSSWPVSLRSIACRAGAFASPPPRMPAAACHAWRRGVGAEVQLVAVDHCGLSMICL
jgi:hypothetical protein